MDITDLKRIAQTDPQRLSQKEWNELVKVQCAAPKKDPGEDSDYKLPLKTQKTKAKKEFW